MKTEFELENLSDNQNADSLSGNIAIIGEVKKHHSPFVSIRTNKGVLHIKDEDLKLFATNILKAVNKK